MSAAAVAVATTAPRDSADSAAAAPIQLSKSTSHFIEDGDLILIYVSHNRNPLPVVVHAGAVHINAFGAFPHSTAFIGKPFGSKIHSANNKGFVYVLRPSPELWTLSLPHRTQILYQTDISFITAQLHLSPGSRIIEAGTGSGSFTHALARTVGRAGQMNRFQGTGSESVGRNDPREQLAAARVSALDALDDTIDNVPTDGRVFSYEFHAQRFGKAKIEFAAHGLSDIVRMTHRNVCKDGFGLSLPPKAGPSSETLDGGAKEALAVYPIVDAVFLDLPAPWEAVPLVAPHLNRDHTTRICCFSPCIEQVLKTVTALNAEGFADVQTWEVLMREIESSPLAVPTFVNTNTGDVAGGHDDEDAGDDDDDEESSKDKRGNGKVGKAQHNSLKRKRDENGAQPAQRASKGWGLERPREVTDVIERILDVEERKEVRRMAQVHKARASRLKREAEANASSGDKEDDDALDEDEAGQDEEDAQMALLGQDSAAEAGDQAESSTRPSDQDTSAKSQKPSRPAIPRRYGQAAVYGRIVPEMRGHTSYLTFGTMLARVPGAEVRTNGDAGASSVQGNKHEIAESDEVQANGSSVPRPSS
ncbi:tRNA (adenine-N(1)-)-methyltransferase catalytic subunit trm61 [Tilletia horrida]|uniref:tRNA (adenine(58)-N(1))-methyltransferase catalytic subunit TRM61 n=1 Tax=Tilletia horrida TaxID=155126 RepID=A0AAN6JVJ3_9BASI|nr:tRNA (adenine-N(1)-)-methyltransferase catalytic subunit trm61 [Tilletia horrida]KAK0568393.1 tRNA (adenine-N(1)-)-methyltransferase catalytic subunit trm61 [Tilletia horrida]